MAVRELVLGIDVCNLVSHICYYDTTTHLAESVPFIGNTMILENPVSLEQIFKGLESGEPIEMEELVSLLAFLIEVAKKHCQCADIGKICITTPEFRIGILDGMRTACERLLYNQQKVFFISHEESYAYYAFSMKKELWSSGVALFDYSPQGMEACTMHMVKVKGELLVVENRKSYTLPELSAAFDAYGKCDLFQVDEQLTSCAKDLLEGTTSASVYLTGTGFDTDQLPDQFLKYICSRRRVFAGQNLYVKGACYAAWEETSHERFINVTFGCHNRVPVTIDLDIIERGQNKIFRAVKAGSNWYGTRRTIDFILEDCTQMVLHMHPLAGRDSYDEIIDLSEIPYRANKTTRVSVSFDFTGDDRCLVTVKDKGFGEIVKSTDKVIYKTLEM